MVNTREDGEIIQLSRLDVQILVALLTGPMGGYEIARQCELDSGREDQISNGSLYRTLNRLKQFHLISEVEAHTRSRDLKKYKITSIGQQSLTWEITTMHRIVSWAHKRLQP